MRFGNAVTVLMAIGGTPPATAARKKKLRHNKPTPPERREQELSMSVDYIMDSLKTPEGIMDTEQSFSEIFHWMPEGKVEICEPYWGSVKVHEEWLDHFPDAEICGTQDDNVCYETDLSCRKQEDDKYSCVTVAKPVDTICDTQEDVCHEKEMTCQYDGEEADNTLTCQTVSSSIGTFCDTNPCLDKQACDGRGTCAGGQDNCPNFGTVCGSVCMEGTCSFPNEAKSCTKDKCSNQGVCDGVDGVCDAEPKVCDDDNTCTDDSCDLDTGICAFDPVDDGSSCDSLPGVCFDNQVCKKGQCVGVDTCPGFGTTCGGKCSIDEEKCVFPEATKPCDKDEDLCLPGVCAGGDAGDDSGTCVVSSPKCEDDGNPCTASVCNSHTGECTYPHVEDDTTCGSLPNCFANQVCKRGECVGDDICPGFGETPCGGTCNLTSRACVYPEDDVEEDIPCDDDGNQCRPGVCGEGTCGSIEPVVCEKKPCQVGTCRPDYGTCEFKNAETGTDCDTIPCFSNQTCNGEGICMAGDDNCPPNPFKCTFFTCDASSGDCEVTNYEPLDTNCNTTACFDDQKCDGEGTCMDGESNCIDYDTDDCTFPICSTSTECDNEDGYVTDGTNCDTLNCKLGQTCNAGGACVGGTDKVCDAPSDTGCGQTCTEASGCTFTTTNGKGCNDNHVCTENDKCNEGTCAGNETICSDVCIEDAFGSCEGEYDDTASGEYFCCPSTSRNGDDYENYPCIRGNYTGDLLCIYDDGA